jgi:hypothetical protein
MSGRPSGRRGKLDTVFFKTENDHLRNILTSLGGTASEDGIPVELPGVEPEKVELSGVDRKPVYLTRDNYKSVHEPKQHSGTVNVEFSEDHRRATLPPVVEKWDGFWGGTEESRILYLRENVHLWGFIREKDVVRRTGVFFIPKKPGDSRLRKILACLDANNCMVPPKKTVLPGPWNIAKIRFRKKRFVTAESDIEAFYSSLVCPKWLLGFFALMPVRAEEVLPFDETGIYRCPVSGETFKKGDIAVPCWPRLPMGFTHSVDLATVLAHEILEAVAPRGAVSLNVEKNEILRQSPLNLYFGSYIDNIFIFCENLVLAEKVYRDFDRAIEDRGLVLSESDGPRRKRKLLGLLAEGDGPRPGLRPPEGLANEFFTVSLKSYVSFRLFERMMGKASWIGSIDRFFFSIFLLSYRKVAALRRRFARPSARIRLTRGIRLEFEMFARLMVFMGARLARNPSPVYVAGDASLEAWAIVVRKAGKSADDFPEDFGLGPSEIVTSIMQPGPWRSVKRKEFRSRLAGILPGELTAFRQSSAVAAGIVGNHRKRLRQKRHSKRGRGRSQDGKVSINFLEKFEEVVDQIVWTDNSICYYAVKKGRSSVERVNALCRFLLLLQLVALVRVHSRWVSTKLMPADYLTRSETLHLGYDAADGSEQPPGRPPGASNPGANGRVAAPSEASDDAAVHGPGSERDYRKICKSRSPLL